jgi:hypothetical protein
MGTPMKGRWSSGWHIAWGALGRAVRWAGDLNVRALLSLFYVLIFGPFALVVRVGRDPLGIERGARKGWRPRHDQEPLTLDRATRQS